MERRDVLALLGLAALLPGCAATGAGRSGLREAAAFREASFYDTSSGERLDRRRLFASIAAAPIVLLGEVHDNILHHRIRGSLLLDWVESEPWRPVALVFEQLDREYDDQLRLLQRGAGGAAPAGRPRSRVRDRPTLDELLEAGRFDRQAWGWPAHQPLFEAARLSGATWIAANYSRASARQLGRDGEVEPVLQAVVESARWSQEAQHTLERALVDGHCGRLPVSALPGITRIQRLRDAALALPLLDAAERRSLLLAGNGHVRRDYGVPRYLGALEREAVVVGFEESSRQPAGDLAAAVGAVRAGDFGGAYHFVCLTRAEEREDPCAGLPPAQSSRADANSFALKASRSSAPSPTPMK